MAARRPEGEDAIVCDVFEDAAALASGLDVDSSSANGGCLWGGLADSGGVANEETPSTASASARWGLLEALELCLLVRDKAPQKYGRAAVRWHSRFVREPPALTIEDSHVLAALGAIAGNEGRSAARAMAELLNDRGFERAGEALTRRAGEREPP
jgi:hypothetical protein